MTVPYSHEAANTRVVTLCKLLFFRWDGSVWQLIKLELLIWSVFYLAINRFYYYFRNAPAGNYLQEIINIVKKNQNTSMLHFLLGFFTMITVTRWWNVYACMEWPDSVSQSLAVHLRQSTSALTKSKVRILRRTMAKHLQLAFVLLLRDICGSMRNRFPSIDSIRKSNMLLNDQEMKMIRSLERKVPVQWCLYWLPFHWLFLNLKKYYFVDCKSTPKNKFKRTQEVYKASLFSNKYEYLHVVKELCSYRGRMGSMLEIDYVPQPTLAFTQAIIFAVYGFIFCAAFSRQALDGAQSYLLVFSAIVEIGIYLAWLKCTLIMINPFGSDRDDFETLWLTDRHWRVIYRILDDPWQLFPVTTFTRSSHHARKRHLGHTFASTWHQMIRGSENFAQHGEMSEEEGILASVPRMAAALQQRVSTRARAGEDIISSNEESDTDCENLSAFEAQNFSTSDESDTT